MKIKQRVRFKDKPFLSGGYIKSIVNNKPFNDIYIVKLDRKAPNQYAWKTDEVMALEYDIEEVESNET